MNEIKGVRESLSIAADSFFFYFNIPLTIAII